MKNILKSGLLALATMFAMTACSPQEDNDHSLGTVANESQLAFSATPRTNANVIDLKNESQVKGVVRWDFGNGTTANGETAKVEYPFKGSYTITMTLFTTGGATSIVKDIIIAADDMSLLNTPMYNALTGGAANLAGKTWVFDQYHNGHFGVGPAGDSPSWWSCPAEGKLESSLYEQEFTFVQVGVKMVWKNKGKIYTNTEGKDALGGVATVPPAGDFDVVYTPKDSYTFTLNETAKTITLSDGAFFGHYAGTSTYDIVALSENELYVRCASAVKTGDGWWYRFVPKEKNVKPEVAVKGVKLAEDFEAEKLSVNFERDNMGKLNYIYDNPWPFPSNTSSKVYMYEKTDSPSSNIFFLAKDYKFDLTKINKVRMKVFIPSSNDYDKKYKKEDWSAVDQLQKMVVVKLHDNGLGGNAWSTQVQVEHKDLETNKWLDLEFDFSGAKDRKDFDKIVIQIGAEGHAGPGIFFFDDFSFDE